MTDKTAPGPSERPRNDAVFFQLYDVWRWQYDESVDKPHVSGWPMFLGRMSEPAVRELLKLQPAAVRRMRAQAHDPSGCYLYDNTPGPRGSSQCVHVVTAARGVCNGTITIPRPTV